MPSGDEWTTGGILLAACLACIPAAIAHHKGRPFWAWFGYALLLWPVATPHAALLRSHYRRCGFCRERSAALAENCWNCGRLLASSPGPVRGSAPLIQAPR